MKKLILASLVAIFGCGVMAASEKPMAMEWSVSTSSQVRKSQVRIPTGVFFNGSDFVKVENTWVRICIDRQSVEFDIRHAELDSSGNYALVLSNGASMTIDSDGRSLYYGGSAYSKR